MARCLPVHNGGSDPGASYFWWVSSSVLYSRGHRWSASKSLLSSDSASAAQIDQFLKHSVSRIDWFATLPFQWASTKPVKKLNNVVYPGFWNNLAASVTFTKAFGKPMKRAPIPGVRKEGAVNNVANCQFVGLEGLTALDQRTHLEVVFFYIWMICTA